MHEPLMAYMDRLEVMAFFAGYPLVYAIVNVIAGVQQKKSASFTYRLVKLLPFAYALSGVLFIGFVLKNIYPDYSVKNIADQFSYLKIWGLSAVLFWIPLLAQKPFLSLLHSLVFFFFLLKDIVISFTSGSGTEIIKNDMKIYSDSLLLNTGALVITVILFYLFGKIRNHRSGRIAD